jgi:hypothetical protein
VEVQLQSLEILIIVVGVYYTSTLRPFWHPGKKRETGFKLYRLCSRSGPREEETCYGYYGLWNVTPCSLVDNYIIIL